MLFHVTIDDIQPARMFFKAGYKNTMTRGFSRLYVFHQAEESQRFLHHEQAHMDKKEICSKRKQGRFTSLYIHESQHSQYAFSNLLLATRVDKTMLSASRIDKSKNQDSVQHYLQQQCQQSTTVNNVNNNNNATFQVAKPEIDNDVLHNTSKQEYINAFFS